MTKPPTEPAFSGEELERFRRFAELLQGDIALTGTHLVFAWLLQQLDGYPLPNTVLARLAAVVRTPLTEFLNAHPEVADALRPAWEKLEERWHEAVRRDALSRSRPHLVRRDTAYEE
jgi:hypothetical protein